MTPHSRQPVMCVCGDHAFAPLTMGYVVLISPQDVQLLQAHTYFAVRTPRAIRAVRRQGPRGDTHPITLAREIARPGDGLVVDHINCDPLDNRRPNLRTCTPYENSLNRRKERNAAVPFKGVSPDRNGKFKASITVRGKRHYLGSFLTPAEASAAYMAAAERLHGPFARLG